MWSCVRRNAKGRGFLPSAPHYWQLHINRLMLSSTLIDEMGYLPLDDLGATIFFQLVSARYERGSIILTSNKSYCEWGSIFGDPIIATAILDRLLLHSVTVNIRGESYRLKERRKAGLIPLPDQQQTARLPPRTVAASGTIPYEFFE